MIINLIRYDREGDGGTYNRMPVKWDTDSGGHLDASSASRYGSAYEFVGVETLDGGLSLTLRFSDVQDVDAFMVTAQSAYADPQLTREQVERWGRLMDSLAALVGAAPKPPGVRFGQSHIYEEGERQRVSWDDKPSYHAGIDARRDPE